MLVDVGLLGYAHFVASGPIAYVVGALGAIVVIGCVVVSQILGMVVRTALYQYATTGDEPDLISELGRDDVFPDE